MAFNLFSRDFGSRVFFLEREGDHWNNMQIGAAGGESSPFPLPFRNTIVFDLSLTSPSY